MAVKTPVILAAATVLVALALGQAAFGQRSMKWVRSARYI